MKKLTKTDFLNFNPKKSLRDKDTLLEQIYHNDNLTIFCIYSLNFSLEFFIIIVFVTNQLNTSKFLPLQLRKTLISY